MAPESAPTALALFARSAPLSPDFHLLDSGVGLHLLLANGNQLFDVDAQSYAALDAARHAGDTTTIDGLLRSAGLRLPDLVNDEPVSDPPVRALSLTVAQKCNLGCTYCYAQQGSFGGPARNMPLDTVLGAVDLLFKQVEPGDRINLSFLGGEPLVNRPAIRAATRRALELGEQKAATPTFSITTNGTLLTAEDGEFFERHGFAVTVSLDGPKEIHDQLRPFKGGKGSFDRIIRNVMPLVAMQRRMQVSARVTVTPHNLDLKDTLDGFVALGFHSVGFSPMLRSPSGTDEMALPDLATMLDEMVLCGEEFEQRVIAGRRYPFANMVNAMREIHRGTHRPYPCGAGAGYLSVSAEGQLSACHRFVGDEEGALGDLQNGVDRRRQVVWLTERHVHRQEPCTQCWARYMCGGGCHHEVIRRGRPACDYIRGWLHYCLGAYRRLLDGRPDYFQPSREPAATR
jgi:uncharacterized protein